MAISKEQAAAIYQDVFFKTAAERGIVADSEHTAQSLLNLAVKTRKIAEVQDRRVATNVSGNVKVANAYLDRYFNGDAALDQLIGAHGKVAKVAAK